MVSFRAFLRRISSKLRSARRPLPVSSNIPAPPRPPSPNVLTPPRPPSPIVLTPPLLVFSLNVSDTLLMYPQKGEPLLLSAPVEILNRIFESCDDFPQVIALASACKRTHAAWVMMSPTIIWSVARSQIRSFDDALMAAERPRFERPPSFSKPIKRVLFHQPFVIKSLSGNSKLPDLAELKEVLNMQHLVRCIEYLYFRSNRHDSELFENLRYGRYPAARRRFPECLREDIPGIENATIDSFRDDFYRAMYRLLLAGALLARAYMAPLFRAREEKKRGIFVRWGSDFYWAEDMDDSEGNTPTEADMVFIRQTPVYNFDALDWSEIGQWRTREYETCFGPFASWIIEDGRRRKQNEPQNPNDSEPEWAENRADVGAVRELMLLLVAYDHFMGKFSRRHMSPENVHYLKKERTRTVSIVRFGIFQIERITMPAEPKAIIDGDLVVQDHPALEGTEGRDIHYQFDIERAIWELEGRMRGPYGVYDREYPVPPAMVELWHFALRHYLNLEFKPGTFCIPRRPAVWECLWYVEVGRGEIFINPNWAAVQKYHSGVISWNRESHQIFLSRALS